MSTTKDRALSGFIWRFAERIGAQGVGFIVSIVLARLLEPEMYGTIALITVFTSILQVFVDSGMGSALIQKKNADELDFSTVFFFNVSVCTLVYILMFLLSPLIASYYGDMELVPLIRVLSLTVLISGVKNIQQAYVSKYLLFKKFFFATLGGTVGAGIIGIYMAYAGYGVWALVAQHIFNVLVDTIILWITVKWRPKFMFSFQRMKELFSYGWKLLISGLIDTLYNDLRSLIIGKRYSSSDLAFYNKGNQFPKLIVANINTSIDSVLLPTMANEQDNVDRVKKMTRRSIQISTYFMAPLMIGLAAIGEPIIRLLLTDKWLQCVLFMRIFCITYMFYPIHTANLNAIKALGRSDLFLKLEVLKKVVGLAAVLITMNISVEAMAYSLLFTSVASQFINTWPNRRLLGYNYLDQLKDILPNILLALFMGGCIYFLEKLRLNDLLTVLLQVVLGAVIYISGSKVLKNESYNFVKEEARNTIKRMKMKNV